MLRRVQADAHSGHEQRRKYRAMNDLTHELDSLCRKVMSDKIVRRDQQEAGGWAGGRGMGSGPTGIFGGAF